MTIPTILDLLKEHGFAVMFIAMGLYFVYKFGELIYKYLEQSIIKKKCLVTKPKEHRFFEEIEYNLVNRVPMMKLYNHNNYCMGRSLIFCDMLKIKLKIWKKHMYMVAGQEYKTSNELAISLSHAVREIVDEYNRQWEIQRIPKIVRKKFNEWHYDHADVLIRGMKDLVICRSFSTMEEKLNAVLELNNALLLMTLLDAEKTLGELNGELSGTFYKKIKLL